MNALRGQVVQIQSKGETMLNKVTSPNISKSTVKVGSLEGGTLVRYYPTMYGKQPLLFVVSTRKDLTIAALCFENGNYISADTEVEVVPQGEVITITAGGHQ